MADRVRPYLFYDTAISISGGEPTLHPHLLEILDLAKSRPIQHLMLNTNGIRIARDPASPNASPPTCPASKLICNSILLRPQLSSSCPCHPDSLAIAYAVKLKGQVIPLTGMLDPKILIEGGRNTIV